MEMLFAATMGLTFLVWLSALVFAGPTGPESDKKIITLNMYRAEADDWKKAA